MVRKAALLAGIVLLTWLAAGCKGGEEDAPGEPPPGDGTAWEQSSNGRKDAGQEQSSADRQTLREYITEISFAEETADSGRLLKTLPGPPEDVIKLVHHWEKAVVWLQIPDAGSFEAEKVLEQITRNGQKADFRKDDGSEGQYRLEVSQPVGASFRLEIAGTPFMTVERAVALSFVPVTEDGTERAETLVLQGGEYGYRVMVPQEDGEVVLQFSEDMVPRLPLTLDGVPVEGEWKDSRRLSISLDGAGYANGRSMEYALSIGELEAASGNRLELGGNLYICRWPAAAWHFNETGWPFAAGLRGRYYSQLAVSPDGEGFVGVVHLGGAMGDGDGSGYSFVLEGIGKEPEVLEHVFFTGIVSEDIPVGWMDERNVAYADFDGMYSYNTETLEKSVLYSRSGLNYAAWDPYRKALYAIAYDSYDPPGAVSAYTVAEGRIEGLVSGFSELALVNKYSFLDLQVMPARAGVYWTRIRNGLPYTEYAADDGSVSETEGAVRLVADNGVYVQTYTRLEQNIGPRAWRFWEPGQQARPIADPPGEGSPSRFFRTGNELLLETEGAYYRYDSREDAWKPWRPGGGEEQAEPVPGPDGLYKVYTSQ